MNLPFSSSGTRIGVLSALIALGTAAGTHVFADDYAVVSAKPSAFIMHAVRAQSVLDDDQRFVQLRGPDRILTPESKTGTPKSKTGFAHLSGFKIGNAADREPSEHKIPLPSGGRLKVTLGQNVSLYAPATYVGNGPSDPLPESSQFWIGYQVLASSRQGAY